MNSSFPDWAKCGKGYLNEINPNSEIRGKYDFIPLQFQTPCDVSNIHEFINLVKACDYFEVSPSFYPIQLYYYYVKNYDEIMELFKTTNDTTIILFSRIVDREVCNNRRKLLDYMKLLDDYEFIEEISNSFYYDIDFTIDVEKQLNTNEYYFVESKLIFKNDIIVSLYPKFIVEDSALIEFDWSDYTSERFVTNYFKISKFPSVNFGEILLFDILSEKILNMQEFFLSSINGNYYNIYLSETQNGNNIMKLNIYKHTIYVTKYNKKYISEKILEMYNKFLVILKIHIDFIYYEGNEFVVLLNDVEINNIKKIDDTSMYKFPIDKYVDFVKFFQKNK